MEIDNLAAVPQIRHANFLRERESLCLGAPLLSHSYGVSIDMAIWREAACLNLNGDAFATGLLVAVQGAVVDGHVLSTDADNFDDIVMPALQVPNAFLE